MFRNTVCPTVRAYKDTAWGISSKYWWIVKASIILPFAHKNAISINLEEWCKSSIWHILKSLVNTLTILLKSSSCNKVKNNLFGSVQQLLLVGSWWRIVYLFISLSLQVVKEVILLFLFPCCCCFKYSSWKERPNREGMFLRLAGLGWYASSNSNLNDNIFSFCMSSGWCCWERDSFLS